jgi:hypothetical protein
LDYFASGGVVGCPALLVEPQAQNTCLQSETFQSWSFTSASGSSGNVAASPSNTQTAGLFIPNSGTTGRGEVACGTLSNATTYSFSCFIKTPTNSLTSVWLYISDGGGGTGANRWGVVVNLTNFTLTDYTDGNGSVTSKAVENYGNGWYRIRVTGQVTSAISGSSVAVIRKLIAGADTNGINGVLVWGAQLETGSVATSYIPTTAGSVTRNADVISLSGAVSGCIGQTEGTLYAEIDFNPLSISRDFITLGDGTNSVAITRTSTNAFSCRSEVTGSVTTLITSSVQSAGTLKIAFGYKSGDSALYINGSPEGTSASSAFPTAALAAINLGNSINLGATVNRIRSVALYTTRLSDSELAALTTL